MRLLQYDEVQDKFSLTKDLRDDEIPPYAILSHTWGPDADEVTYKDVVGGVDQDKAGLKKMRFCARQAKRNGLQHFWIDTCCIDKSNKAELTHAINSMFWWYESASRCYVFLSDVSIADPARFWESAFRLSRWFKRGWTLQELLAPSVVEFFSAEGSLLGTKASLKQEINEITGIPITALCGEPLASFLDEERFSWANDRETTREEDKAYSLLGIFGVYIAPDYGESKQRAMDRLRTAIDTSNTSLKVLHVTDPRDDKKRIEDEKGGLLWESYKWVLENSNFQQWRTDPDSRLLWIKGDPGKGKTMLLCGIIDELKTSVTRGHILSYFFCQATDERINKASAVLRGLLFLLIQQQPSLMVHVQRKIKQAGMSVFEDANAWISLSDIFVKVLLDPALKFTYLIIDALDECAKDLPKLLDFIAKNSMLSPRVRWVVSSRNWPEFERHFGPAEKKVRLCLELNADFVSQAVAIYIRHKEQELAQQVKYDEGTQKTIQDYLLANADGTFLWVSLVCQRLMDMKTTKRNIISKLHSFPPGLNPLYDRMMDQIRGSEDAGICKLTLAVAAVVCRPLTLSEFLTLVTQDGIDDLEILAEIVSLCGSFLTIKNHTVYFVHQSAKDFLLTQAYNKIFPDGLEKVHERIFQRSLDVLSRTLKRDIYDLQDPGVSIDKVQPSITDPLAPVRYSCVHWVDHYEAVYEGRGTISDPENGRTIHVFLQEKYLYWLEALSLLRSLAEGVFAIRKLKDIQTPDQELMNLIQDAYRFLLYNRSIIEQAPLQTYISTLLFSPSYSLVRILFEREIPNWIITKPKVETSWSPCLSVLEGHSSVVNSVAFSHDGRQVVSGSWDKTVRIWDAATVAPVQNGW